MSARPWRAFLAAHPGWSAPAIVGNCVRAGVAALPLALPGAVPAAGYTPPAYTTTELARGGSVIARLPGSAPTAGLSQEVGASGIGAAEMAGLPPVAIAAGGYPAPYLVSNPEAPGCCAPLLGLPNVPLLPVDVPPQRMAPLPEDSAQPKPVPVPEPASVALLGAGLLALGLVRAWRNGRK